MNQVVKEISNRIIKLSQKHGVSGVFNDCLDLISDTYMFTFNPTDFERLKKIRKLKDKYTDDELISMTEIFIIMSNELLKDNNPYDVLGEVYMSLNIANKNSGQFFTPSTISRLMSEITINKSEIDAKIKKYGYISFTDPCVGAGSIPISYVAALKDKGYDTSNMLYIDVADIDLMCVKMTYIQLCALMIPAVVRHMDSLLNKQYDVFLTPHMHGIVDKINKNN